MIRVGAMRHKLVFQRKTESSDGYGIGGTATWSDAVTVWAEKWSVKASERVEAARTRQTATHRWHLRHHAAIVPEMRVKWIDDTGKVRYQMVVAAYRLGNKGRELEVITEEKS